MAGGAVITPRMSADEPLRVVVADDDPFARRLIKGALRAAGMVVVAEAENGREAVELAVHHRPDLVLMDVVMPGLDGILATRRIRKADPDQLVVVLTARAASSARGNASMSSSLERNPTAPACRASTPNSSSPADDAPAHRTVPESA